MKCPQCGHLEDKVTDSRSKRGGTAIRRRRECMDCGGRFTTYEYVEGTPLNVKKGDGRIEPFDRAKLKRGLSLAVVKRPVSSDVLDNLVAEVEEECYQKERDVPTEEIGSIVMKKLKELDEVAYIRFASVYRRFQDVGAFRRELEKIDKR